MKKFFAYEKSVEFYNEIKGIKMPYYLKDQILRAASSITLNLAEGSAKQSLKEQARFYQIAHGSMNECQGVLKLQGLENQKIYNESKFLGWVIWKLIKSRE